MASDRCPYCRQVTVIKILQKNVESLSSVQCSGCNRSYQLALDEGEETTLQKSATRTALDGGNPDDAASAALRAKLGVTLDPDASGTITVAMQIAELYASWDGRLANAVKNAANHPIAKQRAYDEELHRLVMEDRALQNSNATMQTTLHDVSAQVEALGKTDDQKSTMDLIKDAQRNSTDGRAIVCSR
jgi:hypothetical protein